MTRPLQVLQGYYLYPASAGSTRQPLVPMSRDEYTRLSNTTTTGAISSYFVDKQSTQFVVYPWNPPDATAALGTLHLICRVAAPAVALSADSSGFPPEWVIYLRWALADDLATGQPQEVQSRCTQRAEAYRTALEGFDVEDAATYFEPDSRLSYNSGRFR